MASTSVNSGSAVRWENAGTVKIYSVAGTDDYSPLLIVPGSLRFKPGRNERIPIMDRGQNVAVKEGDEQLSEISFTVRPTKAGLSTSSTELMAILLPATNSSGEIQTQKIEVIIPDKRGASTGVKAVFNNCYLDTDGGAEEFEAGGSGKNVDGLKLRFKSIDPIPDYTAY